MMELHLFFCILGRQANPESAKTTDQQPPKPDETDGGTDPLQACRLTH